LETQRVPADDIIATTRTPDRLADLASRGITVRRADFDDPDGLTAAFAGASRALIISTDQVAVPGARVTEHRNAIAAAMDAGIEHVVYTSMMHPDPDSPVTMLAPDHYATEKALAGSQLTWTILRNCWYTDFLLLSLPPVIAMGTLYSAAGKLGVGYVTREDCSKVCAAALAGTQLTNATYDITGPAALNHEELIAIVNDLTGKSIGVVPVTPDQLAAGLAAAGVPPPFVQLAVQMDVNTSVGNAATVSGAVQSFTGQSAQSVRDFLATNLDALTRVQA
jgi:NAD(P)H dehydrogenase (quinone)